MLINNILCVFCVQMSQNQGFVEKMQPVKDERFRARNEVQQSSLKGDETSGFVARKRNEFLKLESCKFLSTEAEGLSDY